MKTILAVMTTVGVLTVGGYLAYRHVNSAKESGESSTSESGDMIPGDANGANGANSANDTNGSPNAIPEPACVNNEKLTELFQLLNERELKIIEKETYLEHQTQELAKIEKGIDEKLTSLETYRKDIDKTLKDELEKEKEEEQRRVIQLVQMFETMKPAQVGALLANLPDELATDILRKMKKETAAKVMAKLPPDRGAFLAQQMVKIEKKTSN